MPGKAGCVTSIVLAYAAPTFRLAAKSNKTIVILAKTAKSFLLKKIFPVIQFSILFIFFIFSIAKFFIPKYASLFRENMKIY